MGVVWVRQLGRRAGLRVGHRVRAASPGWDNDTRSRTRRRGLNSLRLRKFQHRLRSLAVRMIRSRFLMVVLNVEWKALRGGSIRDKMGFIPIMFLWSRASKKQ